MAYDPGAIDATLAAVAGDDPALIADLRAAFIESARAGLSAMEAAPDAEAWREATARLKGLAASFGAVRLMALAVAASDAPPGDAAVLRKLRRMLERL